MPRNIAPHGSSEIFLRAHVNSQAVDCILWPYRTDINGYGSAVINGKQKRASHWMCVLAHGEPGPLRKSAAHNCGNPTCVNPNHLRWATHRENMLDKEIHGTTNRGERNGLTSLTEADVIYIRQAAPNLQALADKFGMTRNSISKVRSGKSWRYVSARVERPDGCGLNVLCRNGHPYDEKNTRITTNGYRQCRACDAEASRNRRRAQKVENVA